MFKGKPVKEAESNAEGFPPELVERLDKERKSRQEVQSSDPEFFAAVSQLMFKHDPISINFGDNTDEYDAEAGTVIPRLKTCTSADDVTTVVHEEFVRWFGEETAGERSRYTSLAKDIWALSQQRWPNNSLQARRP